MRKVSEQETRELIATIGQARSHIQNQLWSQAEASLYRLYHVENKLRELLGEQSIPRTCYHICEMHAAVKDNSSISSQTRGILELLVRDVQDAVALGDADAIIKDVLDRWIKANDLHPEKVQVHGDSKPVS